MVAVAEPDEERRRIFAKEFNLPSSSTFSDWVSLANNLESCDAAVITTLDNQHAEPAIASLNRVWHILVEKPLTDNLVDCERIIKTQEARKKVISVCHTLRFMDGFRRVKQYIEDGALGELVHIEHMEAIGHFRFAHNYVRGRWGSEKMNTFLLLHKCSHDIDYINWLFKERCLRVSSFGSLKYFTPENAPKGSSSRCTNGCSINETCPYSAFRIYVNGVLNEWPARDICKIHTTDEHMRAIKNGKYGLCVWHSGNDVVDHQTVLMKFEGGATATCTLSGYSATNGRRTRVQGTPGEMVFDEAEGIISIKRFASRHEDIIRLDILSSYHPEDQDIVDDWISSILCSTSVTVDAREALRTHTVVFAAEISRREKRTVEMSEMIRKMD